ncbi:MAG: hypothetical protein V2A58_18165, partial [Planctomycetota bacterium]
MSWKARRMIGLAMEERAVLAAEVCVGAKGAKLLRAAEFALPEGASLEDPEALGRALGDFLEREGFVAKGAVIGLPARWLVSKEKRLPPADRGSIAAMVRIEAERSFATGIEQLALDYANGSTSGQVLLTAIARRKVDQLLRMSQAAGRKARGLVPTSMALASAVLPDDGSRLMVVLRPGHVEMVVRSAGRLVALRHLPAPAIPHVRDAEWNAAISRALAQVEALMPVDLAGGEPELVFWDGIGLPGSTVEDIGGMARFRAGSCVGLAELGLAPLGGSDGRQERFGGAAALAVAGARGEAFPVDFLHSRLSVRERPGLRRRIA